jgi:hypothetical protein
MINRIGLGVGVWVLVAICAVVAPRAAGQRAGRPGATDDIPPGMKQYDSPYYTIYTDLEPERVQEAILRMTRMAEEYHERTKEFSGAIRQKFPFFLFMKREDYYAAGAPPGSGGVFMSRGGEGKLMAIAGEKASNGTWHVVQHEGFHQFASAVIGGQIPVWANEGLAEYFGEGIFTGDGMVTGIASPGRIKKIQESIKEKKFKTIKQMMLMSHAQWNAQLDGANYDMAWSMVHFLAHGEEGKYQGAFAAFIRDIGANRPWDRAWEANFGSAEGFEKKWSDWWLAQPPELTKDLYVKATASILASFYGRAVAQKQTFDSLDELIAAGKDQKLKIAKEDWLPPFLLTTGAKLKDAWGDVKYAMGPEGAKTPQIVAMMEDQTKVVATFNKGAKTGRVTVTVDDLVPKMAKAKALIEEKKKEQAKAVLLDAIKRNPKSPKVEEARKMLALTR